MPVAPAGASAVAAPAVQPVVAKSTKLVAESPLPQRFIYLFDLPDLLPELMPLAEAGDMAAMRHLGQRLLDCNDNNLRRKWRELKEEEQEPPATGADAEQRRENREFHLEQMRRQILECEDLPAAQRNSGIDWLERAAEVGSGRARLDYAYLALAEYRLMRPAEVVANIEEIQRRRSLAQRYLAEALQHCVPGALNSLIGSGERLDDAADPRERMINRVAANHALLRELHARGAPAEIQREAQRDIDSLERKLDAAARLEAQRRGELLYRPCARR